MHWWYLLGQMSGIVGIWLGLRLGAGGKENDVAVGSILGYGVIINWMLYRGVLQLVLAIVIGTAVTAAMIWAGQKIKARFRPVAGKGIA